MGTGNGHSQTLKKGSRDALHEMPASSQARDAEKASSSEAQAETDVNSDDEMTGEKLYLIHASFCLCTFLIGLVRDYFHLT